MVYAALGCGILQVTSAYGQLANTGEKIFIGRGAVMAVQGDVRNAGTFVHQGDLKFSGDWTNQSADGGFGPASGGTVVMNGAEQTIGGSAVAAFPRLEVRGSGTKFLDVDTETGTLLLLRELNVNTRALRVTGPDVNAITRTVGFVNTDKGGKLIRNTNSGNLYYYPLGNAERYRPVVIIPSVNEEMSFSVTMFNEDPTSRGFDRSMKREDVRSVFARYFYVVNQDRGTGNAGIRFFLNSTPGGLESEGDIRQLVSWDRYRLWEKAGPSTITAGDFTQGMDRSLLFSSTEPIRNTAFTFGESDEDPLTFFNAFSPDGDGRNDTWTIRNIDLFPENEVTIFNRWGDAVFHMKGYSSARAWDGGDTNPGTYYYVLNVNVNGKMKSYKGFITMLKKD